MPRPLISEQSVREAVSRGEKRIVIPKGSLVTPLAASLITQLGLTVLQDQPRTESPSHQQQSPGVAQKQSGKVVVIGSDHGGFLLKEALKPFITDMGYIVRDVGTEDEKPCDYPDYAYAVARTVAAGEAWRGIMIDGAGIGSCIVANKVPGIRAANCHNEFVARNSREHNDSNLLTLGSRVLGIEVCKEIVKIWLESWFSGGRHKQRVDKMIDVEKKFLRE
jgi:ribose 5-phosphate isomerase B